MIFRRNTRLHIPFGYRMRIFLQGLPVPNLSIMPSLSYIVAPYSLSLSPLCPSICDVRKSDVPGDILLNMYMAYSHSEYGNNVSIYMNGSKCEGGVGFATITTNRTWSTRLPDENSVFTAELQAIRTALAALIRDRSGTFVICSDSLFRTLNDTWNSQMAVYVAGNGQICTLLLGT